MDRLSQIEWRANAEKGNKKVEKLFLSLWLHILKCNQSDQIGQFIGLSASF